MVSDELRARSIPVDFSIPAPIAGCKKDKSLARDSYRPPQPMNHPTTQSQ